MSYRLCRVIKAKGNGCTAALTYNSVYKTICNKIKIENKMSVYILFKQSQLCNRKFIVCHHSLALVENNKIEKYHIMGPKKQRKAKWPIK